MVLFFTQFSRPDFFEILIRKRKTNNSGPLCKLQATPERVFFIHCSRPGRRHQGRMLFVYTCLLDIDPCLCLTLWVAGPGTGIYMPMTLGTFCRPLCAWLTRWRHWFAPARLSHTLAHGRALLHWRLSPLGSANK